MSCVTGVTPRSLAIFAVSRAMPVTLWPRDESSAVTREPTLPDAPMSAIFIVSLLQIKGIAVFNRLGRQAGRSPRHVRTRASAFDGLQNDGLAAVEIRTVHDLAVITIRDQHHGHAR